MAHSKQVGGQVVGDEHQRQLAERLREAREYLGLSQQFVSEQTGIPRVAVSAMENGRRKVEALELAALATLYRHPIAYFVDGALEEPASIRALAREAKRLTDRDVEEVLRFARFLKSSGRDRSHAMSRAATAG